jgi:hypothetical protein
MRKEKYKITEANYRNRPEIKEHKKEYQKLYRDFCNGKITESEFEAQKPKLETTIKECENTNCKNQTENRFCSSKCSSKDWRSKNRKKANESALKSYHKNKKLKSPKNNKGTE